MGTPYKMKGSPMQRNFGVGVSPAKNKTGKGTVSLRDAKGGRGSLDFWNQSADEVKVASKRAAREHYVANDNFSKNKKPANFNMKGGKTTTPDFSTTKLGKAKKIWEKTAKFASNKALGVLAFMGAGTLSATAGNKNTEKSEGEQIKNLLTKHGLKGGK
tara:strand:+ start:34 stop:510 length:477 start_codon:yes stop_codon:yes gene_type:complete